MNWFNWRRFVAIVRKEFIQMRRDKLTFAMMIGVPLLQLTLFGFAINADPKHLPTAVLNQDDSPFSRSLIAAAQISGYFVITETVTDDADAIRVATMRRVGEPEAPDGYVCPGDAAALAVMAGITDAGKAIGRDADIVAKQTSGIFALVRPKVDAIYEDTALAGQQMGELLLRRIHGERPEDLQILHIPEIWF